MQERLFDQRATGESKAPRWSIYNLCMLHLVTILPLARESGVDPLEIWDVLGGYPVRVETIHRLLCAFNGLSGTSYTLDDIHFESDRQGGTYA